MAVGRSSSFHLPLRRLALARGHPLLCAFFNCGSVIVDSSPSMCIVMLSSAVRIIHMGSPFGDGDGDDRDGEFAFFCAFMNGRIVFDFFL